MVEELIPSIASCVVSTYSVSISPSSGDDFITFDSSTRTFTVQTNDNQYGDQTYAITVTGENQDGVTGSYNFNLVTTRDCQYVTLVPTSFEFATYEYRTTNNPELLNFDHFGQVADSHATMFCPTEYEVQFKKTTDLSFTTWTNSLSNFISSYDDSSFPTYN